MSPRSDSARAVPSSLAALLTELELERPSIVTYAWLRAALARSGSSLGSAEAARRLRRLGWLLPLRTRGAWEFAPADRAGPYHGGDPFIEVRALAVMQPQLRIGAGYESAAFLHSLSSRQPAQEVVLLDQGSLAPKSLGDLRHVELTLPESMFSRLDGIRVLTPTGLVCALATKPSAYRDWPGLSEWLAPAGAMVDADVLLQGLAGRPAAAWARASYLLARADQPALAELVSQGRPIGKGPFYIGPRQHSEHAPNPFYDAKSEVIDSVVARYETAGQGDS